MLPAAAQAPAAAVYLSRAAIIRGALGDAAVREWESIEDPFDLAAIEDYADRMATLSLAAQRSMVGTLRAYLELATEDEDEEWDDDEVTGEAIRGDDGGLRHAWMIPAFTMWRMLGEGVERSEALANARDLVDVQARTDLAFAQREAARELGGALDNVIGYRRVVGGSECEFCTVISTRLYHSDDLMPVHPGCTCSVVPVMREGGGLADPGAALDGAQAVGSAGEFEAEAGED